MTDRERVSLKHPFEWPPESGQTVSYLDFRQGRLGDLKGIRIRESGLAYDDMILIASRMSGQVTQVVERLEGEDAGQALGRAIAFFSAAQKILITGSQSSPSVSTSNPASSTG